MDFKADYFLDVAARAGLPIFFQKTGRPLNLNLVGWRNRLARVNEFDDFLAVYWQEGSKWREKVYEGTTLPGKPWLLQPMNKRGTAILVPGHYPSVYTLGYYHGSKALLQTGNFKVYRDSNRDSEFNLDPATIEVGKFGMHMHKAGVLTKVVGLSSAGCQVFRRAEDHKEFMELCGYAADYWGKKFSYTLLEF